MQQNSQHDAGSVTWEERAEERRKAIDALNERAWQLTRVDPEAGLPLALEASILAAQSPVYLDGIGLAKRTIAWGRFLAARYDEAIEIGREALSLLRQSDNRDGTANVLNNLGVFFQRKGDFQEALDALSASLQIRREIDDRRGIAASLLNLGTIAIETGGYVESIEYSMESLRICQAEEDPRGCAGAFTNLGNAYRSLANWEQALDAHTRARELYVELGDRPGEALALGNIGSVFGEQGDPARALEYLREADSIYRNMGVDAPRVAVLQNIGRAERELGSTDTARAHLGAALDICRSAGDRGGIASTLLELGTHDIEDGDPDNARERLYEALEIARDLNARPLLWQIHKGLADLHGSLGEFEDAIDHLEQSHEIVGQLNLAETQLRVRGLQVRHDVESARREGEIHRLRNVELAAALDELKRTQSRVIHAERIASLGSLTAGVAHEINNPVNVIKTSAPSLRRDFEALATFLATVARPPSGSNSAGHWDMLGRERDDQEIEYLLEEIEMLMEGITVGSRRTGQIVRSLSLFSPEESGERKMHDVDIMIDEALRAVKAAAPNSIRFERGGRAGTAIECSAGEIHQLLVAILTNAMQAIEHEGVVEIASVRREGSVEISIRDSGCGMSPEVVGRIFEPFFTTRDVGAGIGLGLSIAYAIVGRHGGEIAVSSAPGEGSDFLVSLPLA